MPLENLSILSLESRQSELVEKLVRQQGGECFSAPSMRERPLEEDNESIELARGLIRGSFDAVVLTTGVGTRFLHQAVTAAGLQDEFIEALRKVTVIARGPKPAAVLRQLQVPVTIAVPEPNTWRETVEAMRGLSARRIAVQEYGISNPELVQALEELGMTVTPVTIYRWALPEDTGPLEEAIRRLATQDFDIVLFLSSTQLTHLVEVAQRLGLADDILASMRRHTVIASIGPIMREALESHGLPIDFTPNHPKVAVLIRQLSEQAQELVRQKRSPPQ